MKLISSLIKQAVVVGLVLTTTASHSLADRSRKSRNTRRPTIIVSQQATVDGEEIRLKHIASLSAHSKHHKELIKQLKELYITESPAPKTSTTIVGASILDVLKKSGYNPNDFGYSIPRSITVNRSGRAVTVEEVMHALKDILSSRKNSSDIRIRNIKWSNTHIIPKGDANIRVTPMAQPSSGKMPLRVDVEVNDQQAAKFLAHAEIDFWTDVPVLARNVDRGMLISPSDIHVVRMNVTQQPDDILTDGDNAIGKRIKVRGVAGSTLRRAQLDIPPLVNRGDTVTLVYRRGNIEATALGTATTEGQKGEVVVFQNTNSKRMVRATITSSKEAEVKIK